MSAVLCNTQFLSSRELHFSWPIRALEIDPQCEFHYEIDNYFCLTHTSSVSVNTGYTHTYVNTHTHTHTHTTYTHTHTHSWSLGIHVLCPISRSCQSSSMIQMRSGTSSILSWNALACSTCAARKNPVLAAVLDKYDQVCAMRIVTPSLGTTGTGKHECGALSNHQRDAASFLWVFKRWES